MLHGLLWLPLLVIFFALAWAGWNEYHKVQGYGAWAMQYEKSKYDVYAALGFRSDELTWGKPLRKGIEDRQVMALSSIKAVQLRVDGQVVEVTQVPESGKVIAVELLPIEVGALIQIPFVNLETATEWTLFLQGKLDQ
jgi:hypothetical protein